MIRVAMLLALVLLAQSVDDGRSRPSTPDRGGVFVDRHVDAHVAPSEGTPWVGPPERSRRDLPPEPAVGTGARPWPTAPGIQLYRDPPYRDRQYDAPF